MRKLLLLICLWVGCLITPQETKAQDISILQKSKRREFLQESFLKSFPKRKNFLYQAERKVSRNLMLNPIQAITISFIFVSGFGTKKRFSQ